MAWKMIDGDQSLKNMQLCVSIKFTKLKKNIMAKYFRLLAITDG
jgi:hypothetical protein